MTYIVSSGALNSTPTNFGTTRPIFSKFSAHVTYGRDSVLLWRRSDTLRISGFVDDVMFAHKLIGCSFQSDFLDEHEH